MIRGHRRHAVGVTAEAKTHIADLQRTPICKAFLEHLLIAVSVAVNIAYTDYTHSSAPSGNRVFLAASVSRQLGQLRSASVAAF
jgi:hypothetical protein